MIASPEVALHGPKEAYEAISRALNDLSEHFITLQLVTVTTPDHPLVRTLAVAVRTGEGISGIRFSRNTVNGRFIEDAYLYRVNI